jgi:6-phospho-beta-glucosidase
LIPNEYLYYYYYAVQSVKNIINAQESRGEQIFHINNILFKELREKYAHNDIEGMNKAYSIYLQRRGETYMKAETGIQHDLSSIDQAIINTVEKEGYAGVALNLIEALSTDKSSTQVLNVANRGAIREFGDEDVVEIPARVTFDHIQPLPTTDIPAHCLGLMKLVKEYERLTINAAVNGSYNTAIWALTIHPLVHDYPIAKEIVNDYITAHKQFFPRLT